MCVCVSCLCRPPSHWRISFIFYTIIGLDPEGGQWLFKFKSNHNIKFNRQNAKQYMWDCSINYETVNIRIRILLLALKMKWSVQCQWLHKTPIYLAEQYGVTHTTKSTQVLQSVHKVMRMHGMQDTLAYSLQSSVIHSRQLLQLRAHTLMCFVGLFPLIKFPQTHSRTRQCNLQVLASLVHGNATCKFELPKLGKIYKLSKFVLRGYSFHLNQLLMTVQNI